MPRATNNVAAKQRRKRILKAAKGYRLGRGKLYQTAKDQVHKSWQYAYRDRKTKKRTFRSLWIVRINAACRQFGVSYSVFMNKFAERDFGLNRKALADLAVQNPAAFEQLVKEVIA